MRILVTGGAGYVGSILVPELLGAGHEVAVLDSFLWRQASLLDCCAEPRFSLVRGDAREEDVLRPLVARADVIIPLAALVGAPACQLDPTTAVTLNRDAIATLVRLASPGQRIIMPCTNSGYGTGEPSAACTEDSPLRPVSLYGRTKVEAEKIILARENSVSLRLATLFGMSPRMRLDLLVNDFTCRALRDRYLVVYEGHFRRNYLHVRDAARAFLHVMDRFEAMRGRPYNVGLSDANLSKLELCARIREQIPDFLYVEAPVGTDPDRRDYLVSNARMEATGFAPRRSLADGIAELIRGYMILAREQWGNR